jgi:hypothetical protein
MRHPHDVPRSDGARDLVFVVDAVLNREDRSSLPDKGAEAARRRVGVERLDGKEHVIAWPDVGRVVARGQLDVEVALGARDL